MVRPLLAALLLSGTAPLMAKPIPPVIDKMLDAAASDADKLKMVADLAKGAEPDSAAEIDAKVAAIAEAQSEARAQALASQGFTEGWSGSGEAGAFLSSGNTNTRGIAIGIDLVKETTRWKHVLHGFADFQRQDGVTTRERYLASYAGNYNITPRLYSLLTLAYEQDRFSGFNSRLSESIGLGYKLINTPTIRLNLEGGPALRQTRFTNGFNDNTFAARLGGGFWWQIAPNLTFTEDATYFYDGSNNSVQALSALTAKINSALSARASFQFNSESNPPPGRQTSDTVSRVTVVYSF